MNRSAKRQGALVFLLAISGLACSDDKTSNPGDAGALEGGRLDSGSSDGGPDSAQNAGLTCDAYCAAVVVNCAGGNAVFPADGKRCREVCQHFPVGTVDDRTGDTLGCRTYHGGGPARQDPTTHCPHAGPYGDNQCGVRCETFCALAAKRCPAAYAGTSVCEAACATFIRSGERITDSTPTGGNTFECRAYHLQAAFDDPTVHCGHIVVNSPTCTGGGLHDGGHD